MGELTPSPPQPTSAPCAKGAALPPGNFMFVSAQGLLAKVYEELTQPNTKKTTQLRNEQTV